MTNLYLNKCFIYCTHCFILQRFRAVMQRSYEYKKFKGGNCKCSVQPFQSHGSSYALKCYKKHF